MKIGIDYDEILIATLPQIIKYHNDKFATNLKLEDFHSYNFWEVWGGTRQEAIDKVHDFFKTPYFQNAKPIRGSQKNVNALRRNHDLAIITARQDHLENHTRNEANLYFPNTFQEIYFGNHYARNTSNEEKTTKKEMCNKGGINLLIDDSLKYATDSVSDERKVLLFNYPWNQTNETLHENIIRVNSWEEALKEIGRTKYPI